MFSLDYVESIVPQVAEILPPLNDVLTVARWLAEITGRDQADVRRRLLTECDSVGRNVCNAATEFGLVPHVWNERMLEFYGVTDAFLFETVTWNSTRMKRDMRHAVCQALTKRLPQGARILCYGDGMGFDSAALARCGFQVTCYEVSGPCLEFARRLFALNQLDVVIETNEEQFAAGTFDAIVCLDVLEHLPDPPAAVRKFSNWLRESGLLVAHAPFYHVDSTRPTHLSSNRRFAGEIDGLYGQAGFQALETRGPLLNPLVLQRRSEHSTVPGLRSRIRLRVAQSVVWFAKFLRFTPGLIAAAVCKPPREWRQALIEQVGNKDS